VTGYGVIGREHLTAALALLDSGRVTAATYLIPDIFHALGLLELDAIAEAIETAENGRQRAERCGALALLPLAYMAAARARVCAGRWDDAFAEIEAGLEVVEDTGSFLAVLSYEAILAEIAIHRGDLATAEAHLAAGTKRFAEGVAVYGLDLLLGAQAEFLAASGQPEAALNIANTTWTQTASARYLYGHRARGILLVRLALAEGHAELADSVTAELEEGARRSPAASAAGAALLCRGLVEQNPDLALGAVAKYRETPMRPDHAACCENAAALLAASGHRNDAVGLLHEAATIYSDIDARAGATRVDAALRELGARARRARANRPRFGWDSLTPMEADVSRLVAEGLTNPEIGARLYISRRTVETHLSHVFRKVGLTSRTHLAAELTRRGTAS
jgi:DNA-binding CsgD family transcriptional regulator